MTVSTVTIHSPDGTSINVPITVTPPSGSPLWQADPTARLWGYDIAQGVCSNISLDPSIPCPSGGPSLRISCADADTLVPSGAGNTPCGWGNRNDEPACIVNTQCGGAMRAHKDLFFRQRFYIPSQQPAYTGSLVAPGTNFPLMDAAQPYTRDLMLSEWYGSPFAGPPPTCYVINTHPDAGPNQLKWAGPLFNAYQIWQTLLLYDQWMDLITHLVFSTDPTVGLVEIWYQGVRQTFTNGSQTYRYATINQADATGPEIWYPAMNYRRPLHGMLGRIDVHFDSRPKVGLTLQDVGG